MLQFQGKRIITIYSGEFYTTTDPSLVIYTLLGSCIAVCLYDEERSIGGMNHFMLPQAKEARIQSGRFGKQSMEAMISRLLRQGAVFSALRAKIFGGARMLDTQNPEIDIAGANIQFILEFMDSRKIPIVARDLGGTTGRKIYYELENNRVFLQRISNFEESRGEAGGFDGRGRD
ncbi:MAG TPA: chemotaxis protein CheD [Bacillota bacterium]|nr:chemotaxis protein CheD [Bacillota bacterium]